MGFSIIYKWQVYNVKRKIDKLTRKIFYSISANNEDPLEYGNIRRADDWCTVKEDIIHWIILVDIIIGKPVQYIITYSILEKKYYCYATTDKNNYSSVLQFATSETKELEFRLTELANHIPSLRERRLREFLFNESKNAPGRKWWAKFLFRRGKTEDYLNGKIENLYNQGRISKKELERLKNYITNLI
ncbi:MAG: hypothetical protein OEV78_02830 [Spirochaetia bacterium]|nr:hypothetical protein [Spirochaetia bacterium]